MFAPPSDETFAPVINRASKMMTSDLDPLHERQVSEHQRRIDRLQQLAATVESERRRHETFAPRTNKLPPGMSMDQRVPLQERTNLKPALVEDAPQERAAPRIDPASEAMVTAAARQHIDLTTTLRRKVQSLWSQYAQDSHVMDKQGAKHCAAELDTVITTPSMRDKFLLALGFQDDPDIPRDRHVLHVDYARFCKVVTAVLKAAAANHLIPQQRVPSPKAVAPAAKTVGHAQSQIASSGGKASATSRRPSAHERTEAASANPAMAQQQQQRSAAHKTRSHSNPSPVAVEAPSHKQQGETKSTPSGGRRQQSVPLMQGEIKTAAALHRSSKVVVEEPTFAPQINPSSARVAAKRPKQPIDRPAMKEETRILLDQLKEERVKKDLGECSFVPKTNATPRVHHSASRAHEGGVASSTSQQVKGKPDTTLSGDDESPQPRPDRGRGGPLTTRGGQTTERLVYIGDDSERSDAERTPARLSSSQRRAKLTARRSPSGKNLRSPSASSVPHATAVTAMLGVTPGFEKAVQRMAIGRAIAKPKFEESLRGGTHLYDPHVFPAEPSATLAAPAPPTEPIAPALRTQERSTERELSRPLLYVDVDLPHGKVGRIGVHRGDRAEQLAQSFCVSYGLDDETASRLTDILQLKIDAVTAERTRTMWV